MALCSRTPRTAWYLVLSLQREKTGSARSMLTVSCLADCWRITVKVPCVKVFPLFIIPLAFIVKKALISAGPVISSQMDTIVKALTSQKGAQVLHTTRSFPLSSLCFCTSYTAGCGVDILWRTVSIWFLHVTLQNHCLYIASGPN